MINHILVIAMRVDTFNVTLTLAMVKILPIYKAKPAPTPMEFVRMGIVAHAVLLGSTFPNMSKGC